jgi:hypothetical protein
MAAPRKRDVFAEVLRRQDRRAKLLAKLAEPGQTVTLPNGDVIGPGSVLRRVLYRFAERGLFLVRGFWNRAYVRRALHTPQRFLDVFVDGIEFKMDPEGVAGRCYPGAVGLWSTNGPVFTVVSPPGTIDPMRIPDCVDWQPGQYGRLVRKPVIATTTLERMQSEIKHLLKEHRSALSDRRREIEQRLVVLDVRLQFYGGR